MLTEAVCVFEVADEFNDSLLRLFCPFSPELVCALSLLTGQTCS